jgi:hypothetical protein
MMRTIRTFLSKESKPDPYRQKNKKNCRKL